MTEPHEHYLMAERHLARRDSVLRRLIATIGPCRLRIDPDSFGSLIRSIIAQQISTRAAASIAARLTKSFARGLTPEAIRAARKDRLQRAGLSPNKILAIRDLATKVCEGHVVLHRLRDLTDEEVIDSLVVVRGIGRWTAEMFLIFSLGRLDVLPVNDLGLRVGVQKQYGLAEVPGRDTLHELADPWRPYRSIATWYIWRSLGGAAQI